MAKFVEQRKSLIDGIGFKLSFDYYLNCHYNLLADLIENSFSFWVLMKKVRSRFLNLVVEYKKDGSEFLKLIANIMFFVAIHIGKPPGVMVSITPENTRLSSKNQYN
jgi:hypothetical protein